MLAIVLARVSSQEQEEGHSIAAQKKRLLDYCERNALTVIRTFELVESSTRGDRKEFHQLLAFAKEQKERVAIVADAVDRVQRSFKESVLLDDLRRSGRVEVHFLREGLVLNEETPAHAILLWDFATISAKAYVAALSDNVRRSLAFKIQNGEWTSRAPVGYLNVADPKTGKRTIVVDEQRAPIVRNAFVLYATGRYSVAALADRLRHEGLTNNLAPYKPLSTSMIYRLLANEFYAGTMTITGKQYPHRYPPLIDEWLYWKCQSVRQRFGKQPFKYAGKAFIFRGLLRCAFCGCSVSSDTKKGRYTYLRCTQYRGKCGAIRVREEVVLTQVAAVLRKLELADGVLADLKQRLRASFDDKKLYHDEAIASLRSEYDQLQRSLDALLDLRLHNEVSEGDYSRKCLQLKEAQIAVNLRIDSHTKADEQFGITASRLLTIASHAGEVFEQAGIPQRRELLAFLFSNLSLRGEKLDYKLKEPFDAVLSASASGMWLPLVEKLRTELFDVVVELRDEIERAIMVCGSAAPDAI